MKHALAMLLCLAALGCGAAQKPREHPAALRVIAEPPAASVQVDEHYVGSARVLDKKPAQLRAGKHRVTIEAPGYFPHDLEVELKRGVTTLQIKLRPVPP